jgi:hypothetical protein
MDHDPTKFDILVLFDLTIYIYVIAKCLTIITFHETAFFRVYLSLIIVFLLGDRCNQVHIPGRMQDKQSSTTCRNFRENA